MQYLGFVVTKLSHLRALLDFKDFLRELLELWMALLMAGLS